MTRSLPNIIALRSTCLTKLSDKASLLFQRFCASIIGCVTRITVISNSSVRNRISVALVGHRIKLGITSISLIAKNHKAPHANVPVALNFVNVIAGRGHVIPFKKRAYKTVTIRSQEIKWMAIIGTISNVTPVRQISICRGSYRKKDRERKFFHRGNASTLVVRNQQKATFEVKNYQV